MHAHTLLNVYPACLHMLHNDCFLVSVIVGENLSNIAFGFLSLFLEAI